MYYNHCSEATVILVPIWKQVISKRGILKSLVSHVQNFKSWIKLNYDKIGICNFVINEINSTFEVQNMRNKAFQNASFGNALFPNEVLDYSCLWAISDWNFFYENVKLFVAHQQKKIKNLQVTKN